MAGDVKLSPVQLRLAMAIDWYGWIEDVGNRSLKAMEKRGLVWSSPCPTSAIRLQWRLTEAGSAALRSQP